MRGASWRPLLTSLGSKEMKSRWNWGSITCIMCFTCVGSQLSMSSSKASSFSGPLQLYRRGHFDYLKDAPVTNAPACLCLRRELHGKGPWAANLPLKPSRFYFLAKSWLHFFFSYNSYAFIQHQDTGGDTKILSLKNQSRLMNK